MAEPDELQPHGEEDERLPGNAPDHALRDDQLEGAQLKNRSYARNRRREALAESAGTAGKGNGRVSVRVRNSLWVAAWIGFIRGTGIGASAIEKKRPYARRRLLQDLPAS